MSYLYPTISALFDDFDSVSDNVLCSPLSVFSAPRLTGYCHVLPTGNGILITDDFMPYLITKDFITEHKLSTGDKLDANVGFSSLYDRYVVLSINKIDPINYKENLFIKANRDYILFNSKIKFGNTAIVKIKDSTKVPDKVSSIIKTLPFGSNKILFCLDRPTADFNLSSNDCEMFTTKLTYSNREKLSVCLLSFFKAKELASSGKDVFLIVDSLDKMFHVYNSCMQKNGYINPGYISTGAMTDLESILFSSACIKDRGSLNIIVLHKEGDSIPQKYITERFNQICEFIIE